MPCRLITSPITKEQVQSKTWNDLYELSGQNEREADRLYEQLLSPEFTSWFGDWINNPNGENVSKVVNDIGEPLIVYHGTSTKIEEFSKDFLGKNTNAPSAKKGFFFSSSYKNSISYTEDILKQSKKLPFDGIVYLDINNATREDEDVFYSSFPKSNFRDDFDGILTDKEIENLPDVVKNLPIFKIGIIEDEDNVRQYSSETFTFEQASWKLGQLSDFQIDFMDSGKTFNDFTKEHVIPLFLNLKNPLITSDNKKEYREETYSTRIDKAIEKQKDSLIVKETKDPLDTDIYVAFEPNQIKSVFNKGTFSSLSDNIYLSSDRNKKLISSKAAPSSVKFVEEFLKRLGVDIDEVSKKMMKEGMMNLKNYDGKSIALGIADFVQRTAWILEGKKDIALTEEAMHFAVAIIKELNPSLYKKMYNASGRYQLTKDVINDKGYREMYALEDGKPNVPKLKEEAIGKLLAEYVIQELEGTTEKPELIAQVQSWWQDILDWFKKMFNKVGMNISENPFEDVAASIVEGRFEGTAEDIREGEIMFALEGTNKQEDTYNKIRDTSKSVVNTGDGYLINGVKVPNRVSDLKGAMTPEESAKYETQRIMGVNGHADIEDIANRYIDESGFLRKDAVGNLAPLPRKNESQLAPENITFYNALEDNFRERLLDITNNLSDNTRFLIEAVIYDPNYSSKKGKGMAGTMDFVAIHEDGSIDIFDWKFINKIQETTKDVNILAKKGYNIQLTEYKRILKDVYGATDIRKTRAVPIRFTIFKGPEGTKLRTLDISPVDYSKAQFDYQLPVPIMTERTGQKEIDKQIDKLQALYESIYQRRVVEGRRDIKDEQLNLLMKTIRHLQVKQDLSYVFSYIDLLDKEVNFLIQSYKDRFKGKPNSDFSDTEISDFGVRILSVMEKYAPFDSILDLADLYPPNSEEYRGITESYSQVKKREKELRAVLLEFADEFIGKRNDVQDLIVAEKEYGGFVSYLRTLSEGGPTEAKLYGNIIRRISGKITIERNLNWENYRDTIATPFKEWVKRKGLSDKDAYNLIFAKGKDGKFENRTIDTINKDMFPLFDKALKERNHEWLEDNMDLEAYKQEALRYKEQEIANLPQFFNADPEIDSQMRTKRLEDIENRYNFNTPRSSGWFQPALKHYPKEKWFSKEYQELLKPENKPALDFYEHIQKWTKRAASLGMVHPSIKRTFLPYVRAGFLEVLLSEKGFKNPLQGLVDSITIQDDDYEFGYKNPVTGEWEYDLRPRFSTPMFEDRPEELSKDLLKTMQVFMDEVIRFENLTEAKGTIETLLKMSKLKTSLQTSGRGKLVKKGDEFVEQDNNDKNYEFLFNHIKATFYGITRADQGQLDRVLAKIPQNWEENFKVINSKLPFKLFPQDIGGKSVYLPKVMDSFRKYFQLKVLNLNIGIAAANMFGGSFQRFINSGDYYTEADLTKSFWKVLNMAFKGEKDQVLAKLIVLLEPYIDSRERRRTYSTALSKAGDTAVIQDVLMAIYKYPTMWQSLVHAVAMFESAVVINGQVVNVNQYLRDKYSDRFSLPYTERRDLEKKMVTEAKELLKTNGLLSQARLIDNKLILPEDVKLTSESLLKYRDVTLNLSKQFLGASTQDDINRANQNALWSMFMVFKNWIPPLMEPRVSELKLSPGTDRWEIGRWRVMAKIVGNAGLKSGKTLRDVLLMNDDGVKFMDNLLEKEKLSYKERHGKELKIEPSQYKELYSQAVRNQIKDFMFYVTLAGIVVAASNFLEDDDDPETQGYSRFTLRMLNKIYEEMSFYYDASSMIGIAAGSLMPPLSLVNDFKKLMDNVFGELWGLTTQNDELTESSKPLKYLFRMHPLTNNLMYYAGVASDDIRKSLDIRITSQARGR